MSIELGLRTLGFVFVFFFFFKQKTAYEMRISDWSSDVCSSDLLKSRVSSNAWTLPHSPLSSRGLAPGPIGVEAGRFPTTKSIERIGQWVPATSTGTTVLGVGRARPFCMRWM